MGGKSSDTKCPTKKNEPLAHLLPGQFWVYSVKISKISKISFILILIVYRRTLIIDIFSSFKIHFIFLAWKILLAKKFSSKVMMKSLTPILKNWLEEQETTFDSLRAMSTATGSLMGILPYLMLNKYISKLS